MQERLVHFHLFGQEFTFFSDAPEEEVEAIITLLRQELDSGEKISKSAVPSSKMLVLGCLRMTAKYVQLQRECQYFRQSHVRLIDAMVAKIESGLD